MGLKSAIAPLVHRVGFVSGYSRRRAAAIPAARIITFHAVGVPSCPAAAFTAQLGELRQQFEIVPLTRLLAALRENDPRLARLAALTFDDGTRNNLTIAFPVLRRLKLPAVFFVCPGLVGRGVWLWNHEARERLRSLPAPAFAELADSLGRAGESCEQVVHWLKSLPTHSRQHIEIILRDATPGFRPSVAQQLEFDLMDWAELKSLDPQWITLGAHSTNHPILAHCPPDELTREVTDCRQLLERELQRPAEFFCYPNGDFNPAVAALARATYSAAVTTQPGFVHAGTDPHELPRLNCAATPAHFAWRLHRPGA